MANRNPWCDALGVAPPDLAEVSREVLTSNFALLVAALLEHGAPMTLRAVARRAAEAGLGDAISILIALERCRPGRPPVYRDGDRYALDPLDPEIRFWPMRLGIDPRQRAVRTPREVAPTPPDDAPLQVAELAEAWARATGGAWSTLRIALAALDAHGRAMTAEEIEAFVRSIAPYLPDVRRGVHTQRGGPLARDADGRLELTSDADGPLRAARAAVRARLRTLREAAALRPSPEETAARREAWEARRQAAAAALDARRDAVVAAFPPTRPVAVAVLDVEGHAVTHALHPTAAQVAEMLAGFDAIGGLGVRALLAALGVDAGPRRLLELGAMQKGRTLNRAGRTLRISPAMLIEGSCGIAQPLGGAAQMRGHVRDAAWATLARRVEADARSLAAMLSYGRLHGAMRLRWGFLDEFVRAEWADIEDPRRLYELKRRAFAEGRPLEVVLGRASWEEPWGRAVEVVVRDLGGSTHALWLDGVALVRDADVVAARVKA